MTGIADCCARAESGHVTATLPIKLINSRRLMAVSGANAQDVRSIALGKGLPTSALGQKRTHAVQQRMSSLGQKRTLHHSITSAPASNVGGTFETERPSGLHIEHDCACWRANHTLCDVIGRSR